MYVEGETMHRTQIYLDSFQVKILKELAAARGATLSQLIREAIGNLIAACHKPKSDPFQGIVALYRDERDPKGSLDHDDLYEE